MKKITLLLITTLFFSFFLEAQISIVEREYYIDAHEALADIQIIKSYSLKTEYFDKRLGSYIMVDASNPYTIYVHVTTDNLRAYSSYKEGKKERLTIEFEDRFVKDPEGDYKYSSFIDKKDKYTIIETVSLIY